MDPETAPSRLSPVQFRPVLKHYVWGGRRFEEFLGRSLPEGPTAESWEISDHPNGETPIAAGPWAGSLLRDLQRRYGPALVGARNLDALDRKCFPLLIKLLDANDWLSVQVHPADDFALEHEADRGKTEMWVVLHAEPDAEILLGFDRLADKQEFSRLAKAGETNRALHRVSARAGDVFFVPAGRIHAIGPGLVLAEIQQASDVTYRVFDWNRSPTDDRPLHFEQALAVTDFSDVRPGPVEPVVLEEGARHRELLVECPYFRAERLRLRLPSEYGGRCNGATFEIWGAISGQARLEWRDGGLDLTPVSWVLLPANLGSFKIRPVGENPAQLLRVLTPTSG